MKRSGRSWSAWARGGSIAMAALAVVSLAATVIASYRALADASEIVVRGEGDLLLGTLVSELAEETNPASAPSLERALEAHRTAGLRYLAIVDRDGSAIAEAGHGEIAGPTPRPGESRIEGRRARVAGLLFPPRRARGGPPPFAGGRPDRPLGAALLVLEHEPPVIETLRRDLVRIGVVASVAGAVLLAFALAWSRSARRLEELESRAAREQRLIALGSMSSVMAHELRNPLASLKGHAQLLAEDLEAPSDSKKKAKAERVIAEAERLEGLTTSLLDFVRDGPIERTSMSPQEIVTRSIEDLAKDRVKSDLRAAPAAIDGDTERIVRALHNIVDNALQASSNDPVELTIAQEGAVVVIVVRDHGPGIPAESAARIFEPFVTTRVRGTGLGLAVARRIAEQHDGTLTAENHPSGGAVFTLRLPGRQAS